MKKEMVLGVALFGLMLISLSACCHCGKEMSAVPSAQAQTVPQAYDQGSSSYRHSSVK